MKHFARILLTITLAACASAGTAKEEAQKKKHLFILSGQSNMAALKEKESFIPAVEKAFGKENILIVKDAQGSTPIRNWAYRPHRERHGFHYNRLMKKVNAAVGDKTFDTVTFVWIQGESDALKKKSGAYYKNVFKGILKGIKTDLKRTQLYFVIGRINDHKMDDPHWKGIRDAQVELAEEDPNGQWVSSDDLNTRKGREDIHMTKEGYKILGKRFAEKAIALINGTASAP